MLMIVICKKEEDASEEKGGPWGLQMCRADFCAKPLIENNNSFLHRTVKFQESNCKCIWDGRGANQAKRSTVREKRKAY